MTREQTIYVPFEKLEDVFGKEERGVFLPYREFLEMWNRLNLPEKLKNSEPPVEGVLAAANYAGAATRCSFPPRAATKSRQWSSGRIARATGRSTLRLKLPRTSVSQFKMTIPEKGLDFASTPAAAFSAVENADGSTRLIVYFGASQEVNISRTKKTGETALAALLFADVPTEAGARLLQNCRRSSRGSRATAEIRKPCGAFWTGDRERWRGLNPVHSAGRRTRQTSGLLHPEFAALALGIFVVVALDGSVFAKGAEPERRSETVVVPYDPAKPVAGQKPDQFYLPYEHFLQLWEAAKQNRAGVKAVPFALSAARYEGAVASGRRRSRGSWM